MQHFRKIFFLLCLSSVAFNSFCQKAQFSLATDFCVLRSFKKQQQYWAVGQTVTGHFHFAPKDGAYAWLTYFTNGSINNQLTASAKLPATLPQEIAYTNRAKLRFKHVSFGWKHYLKGAFDIEQGWGLYGFTGLGLMIGSVENTYRETIDTAFYNLPLSTGRGRFKRLTMDFGLGFEKPLGGDFYLYMEGRTLIPVTDYPSNYLFVNKYAPLTASLDIGFRIYFE